MENEMRLIDAEPIKKFIVDGLNNPDLKKAFGHDAIEILAEIEYAPIVDAVPVVHGRWLWTVIGEEDREQYWRCSVCNDHSYIEYNYCPHCGAKMDRGNENG